MSKIKTLKQLLAESPEQVSKIIRGLRGEADDAVTKLGSGKNLEALQKASTDLADQARQPFPPAYPKTVVQDDLAKKAGFKLEGKPYSTEGVMVPEGTGVPMIRQQTLPDVVEGVVRNFDDIQVLPPMNIPIPRSSVQNRAVDLVENFTDPKKSLAKRLGLGGAAVAGGAGVLALQDQEEPAIQQVPAPVKKEDSEATSNEEKQPVKLSKEDQDQVVEIGKKVAERPESVTEQEVDYLRMLQQAQQDDNQSRLVNNLLRAGTTIGAAIAGVKPDYSGVDELQKQVSGVSQVRQLMKTEQAQRQLNDDKSLRDPNSAVSKQMRAALVQAGMPVNEKISAQNLKDMGVNIYNILGQKQAAEIAARARIDARGLNEEDRQKRFVQSLRKELVTGAIGKQYSNYLQSERIGKALVEFRKNPSGYKDYATLMGGLKALQGDESVVREAEVRMGRQAASLIDTAINSVEKLKSGKMLTDRQRGQMIDTIETLGNIGRETFLTSAAPIMEQADREGIDRELILPKSLVSKEPKKQEETGKQDSQMVRVKRLSDGAIKVVPRSTTVNLDKNKYKIMD
jgi:hypothetical protein